MKRSIALAALLGTVLLALSGCQCGGAACPTPCPAGTSCVNDACRPVTDAGDGNVDAGAGDSGTPPTDGGGPVARCGDGMLAPTETCDDGNAVSLDGCSQTCTIEPGFVCPLPGKACVRGHACGDGQLSSNEQCDDRNTVSTDGCSGTCTLEPGWVCPTVGVACLAAACGDGKVAGPEECDDGNTTSGDGCTRCTIDEGFQCPTPGAACVPTVCGDGQVQGIEQCDDGNNNLGDGCDTTCHREPRCTRGLCTAICGDGIKMAPEACDDGNTRPGDGCSADCHIEAGFTCTDLTPAAKTSLAIPIVYRDFRPAAMDGGHIDFETASHNRVEPGIVLNDLGSDGKPVYNPASLWPSVNSKASFDQWYRDTPGINLTLRDRLVVTQTTPGTYVFDSGDTGFYPLDGRGFWADGGVERYRDNATGHNWNFTSELRYWFNFAGDEVLTFLGDDDVWVFINGRLLVDLGGAHTPETGTVTLNAAVAADAGLFDGGIYEVALFQAERQSTGSNYKLTLKGFNAPKSTCAWLCGDGVVTRYEACDDGVNDGGYGGCMPGCLKRGPTCGDAHVDTAFGETCDDGDNFGLDGGCLPGCRSAPRCGDGIVDLSAEEECDDGNVKSGDGCSSTCLIEVG